MERDSQPISRIPPAPRTCPKSAQGNKDLRLARCTIVLNDRSEVLVSMRADLTLAVQGQGQGRWDAGDALISLNERDY